MTMSFKLTSDPQMGRFGKQRGRGKGGFGSRRKIPTADDIIEHQLEAFVQKFGRLPQEGEPIFFDPDKDVPAQMDFEKATVELADAMRKANVRPELIYAYEKTGMILVEGEDYDPDIWEEYQAAMREYFEMKKAGKLSNS